MFRLVVFTLCCCVYSVLAYRIDYGLQQDHSRHRWARDVSVTVDSKDENGLCHQSQECKKDIWILWDNSFSVGKKGFNERIRPFIKKLIKSERLNVGPDGTHIGILTFSTQKQTRVLVELGEYKTQEELLDYLEQLKYDDVKGDGTRTGMALKIADEKLFPEISPFNNRSDVDDVVMVFTDGEPVRRKGEDHFGKKYKSNNHGERLLALDHANKLKSRSITVVGLAVGIKSEFRDDIRKWATSNDTYFETDEDKLDSILKNITCGLCLINEVCTQCGSAGVADKYYTAPGENATTEWQEPTPTGCSFDTRVVEPLAISPATFGAGKHNITYTYILSGTEKLNCPVTINVVECKCLSNAHASAELPEGENEAEVSWTVRKPNCDVKLINVSRPGAEKGEGRFPIGQHSVIYNYEYKRGLNSFTLSCPVTITVEGELCRGKAFNSKNQVCCCGVVHPRKPEYHCCGIDYYDTKNQQCCENANLVSKQDSCPKSQSKISVH